MNNDGLELVFILDRSGSMGGLEKETIDGFNNLIETQKEKPGEVLVSTVLFDNRFEVLHNRIPIEKVSKMTEETYYVRGTTALLDAIGKSILKIRKVHKELGPEKAPKKTLFFILTDGYENASKEFDSTRIKDYIELQKEKYGWEFIFMGANIDAVETGRKFGLDESKTVNYHADEQGVHLNYRVMSDAVTQMRVYSYVESDWKKEIDADFKSRKKS